MRAELFEGGIPTALVVPTQLKKWVGAKGSKKSDVKKGVDLLYNYTHKSSDVVDAYVLARMAEAGKRVSKALNGDQRELVGKLRWLN